MFLGGISRSVLCLVRGFVPSFSSLVVLDFGYQLYGIQRRGSVQSRRGPGKR